MNLADALSLLGGVSLFLFGMTLMGEGLKLVAGNKLELILYKLSGTPLKGILLGTGVTAVIQSSSATSVMVVGFVNSGMMKMKQAISIIMGAIIGTSITGWIISLSDIGGSNGLLSLLSTETTSPVGVPGSSSFFPGTSISTLDLVVVSSSSVLSAWAIVAASSVSLALCGSELSKTGLTASHPHKQRSMMNAVMISDFLMGSPP